MRKLATSLLSLLLALGVAGPASATGEGSLLFNWTETWITPGDQGPNVEFMSGSEEWDLFGLDPSVEQSDFFPCDVGQQCDPSGIVLEITLPNFVDPLPRKIIDILFEGANPDPLLPTVLDVTGFDTPFGTDLPEETLIGFPVPEHSAGIQLSNGFIWKEQWKILPNPDWEIIRVLIPFEFEWVGVHITTQSVGRVPEPSALALVSVGLTGLLLIGRRRR